MSTNTYSYNGFTTGQKVWHAGNSRVYEVGFPGPRGLPERVYVSDGAHAGHHFHKSELVPLADHQRQLLTELARLDREVFTSIQT